MDKSGKFRPEASPMYTLSILLLSLLFVFHTPAFAVSIYQCEDANGNVTFQDRCPPGTKQLNQRNYDTTAPAATASAQPGLTLYLVPGCDTCEQLKEFLSVRNLRFTEKDVSQDVELQNELKEVAGELQVPALTIGDKVLTGYNRTALIQSLTESGHITGTE
jgi:glutaredoxin